MRLGNMDPGFPNETFDEKVRADIKLAAEFI